MLNAPSAWRFLALALWAFLQGNCFCHGDQSIHSLLASKLSQVTPTTNITYHLPFTWDAPTSTIVTGYTVIVRTNETEMERINVATNFAWVSNLQASLDAYRFTCVATNVAGVSDESNAAVLRWFHVTDLVADNPYGPWLERMTNQGVPAYPQQYFRSTITNWSAVGMLSPD